MFVNQLIFLLVAVSASPIVERDDSPPSTLIADHPELAKRSDGSPSTLIADHPELLGKRDGVAESDNLSKRDITLRDISEEVSCGGYTLYSINVPSDVTHMPPQSDPIFYSYAPYWNFDNAPYVCKNPLPINFPDPIDPHSPSQALAICQHCSQDLCRHTTDEDLSGGGFVDKDGIVFGYEDALGM
ncbi:hypothetical protein HDV02_004286 [Globomyces sp. JEL0801]|nr:hypothetical protein HDV02_004286 [Globomyces sp. JEL0801]